MNSHITSLEAKMSNAPRVLLFAMHGPFATHALTQLITHKISVHSIVIPAMPSQSPSIQLYPLHNGYNLTSSTIPLLPELAKQYAIPLYTITSLRHPDIPMFLEEQDADFFCTACFPKRFPKNIVEIPAYGCLNIHPSLLPKHRGPDPIFWVLHNHEKETGVTVHFMNEHFDAGNIVTQQVLCVEKEESYASLVARSAESGGQLLVQAINKVYKEGYKGQPQDESLATYESFL